MTAPDFTVTLSPAQWEHLAEHGWTLTAAPGEVWDSFLDGPTFVPVPATVPCPECEGDTGGYAPCDSCNPTGEDANPGVVPRVVGIVRPAEACELCVEDGHIPQRVGTATVTAVPVVDERGWLHDEDTPPEALVVELDDSLVLVSHRHQHDATALFATPPAPGCTVWRLDKENDHA